MKKNPYAVRLGRAGGIKSARARSRKEGGLKRWAQRAARSRWGYSLRALSEDTVRDPENWRVMLKEFFREAALRPLPTLISREPRDIGKPHRNAYVAALAEVIARTCGFQAPPWVYGRKRSCPYPYFGNAPEGMKPYLIQMSPFPFRRRNLFIDPDEITGALDKARSEVDA